MARGRAGRHSSSMTSTTSPSRPRRLTRSSSDKMIGGVAGGLAEYFDVDPVIVRVGFAVSTAFSGSALLAYLLMLLIVPRDDNDTQPLSPPLAAFTRSLPSVPHD